MRRIHAHIFAVAVIGAAAFAVAAQAHTTSSSDRFSVVSVKVLDAFTADVTFSHQLATGTTDASRRHFYGDHLDHEVPHTHDVSRVALVNDGKTARLTFSRGLHPEEPPCDEPLPKCSDDEIPLIIRDVADIHGHVLSNDDWEVWAVGADD